MFLGNRIQKYTIEDSKSLPNAISNSPDYIVRRFFSYPSNYQLLCAYLKTPSFKAWKSLEEAFILHHFEVRFSKYLSSTIKYAYIDFYRKKRKSDHREVIIFDMAAGEENDSTFGEKHFFYLEKEEKRSTDPQLLLDSIYSENLYNAFSKLTQRQKQILAYTYSMGYLDKEIATILAITPQAVSKSRRTALATLKKRIRGGID